MHIFVTALVALAVCIPVIHFMIKRELKQFWYVKSGFVAQPGSFGYAPRHGTIADLVDGEIQDLRTEFDDKQGRFAVASCTDIEHLKQQLLNQKKETERLERALQALHVAVEELTTGAESHDGDFESMSNALVALREDIEARLRAATQAFSGPLHYEEKKEVS